MAQAKDPNRDITKELAEAYKADKKLRGDDSPIVEEKIFMPKIGTLPFREKKDVAETLATILKARGHVIYLEWEAGREYVLLRSRKTPRE